MEFSSKKLIRLSGGLDNKPTLSGYLFEHKNEEYLYVRHLDNTEALAFGDYFFMRLIRGEDGSYGCEYISDIKLAYSLWSEIIKEFSLEEVFKKGNRFSYVLPRLF